MAYGSMVLEGKRYVLVPAAEFDELTRARGVPPLPPAAADGTMDAVAFGEAAIARNLVSRREAVGLTQRELADAAGIRAEVLDRAERGVAVPSVRTLTKIEAALVRAAETGKRHATKRSARVRVNSPVLSRLSAAGSRPSRPPG